MDRTRGAITAAALSLVLVGGACAPAPSPPGPASASPSPTASQASPSARPTPDESPTPDRDAGLPSPFPVTGRLLDDAAPEVVKELHRLSGWARALKLDLTADQVTLTVLTPDKSTRAYRWRDGVISVVDSDVQYLGQATFIPTRFPLDKVRAMFTVAALMGADADLQELQIVEYRGGRVYLTVSTRPETTTVFFRSDGTVVRHLEGTSAADLIDGLTEVTEGQDDVLAMGYSPERGYWADVPGDEGTVVRHTRTGNLPTFSAERAETSPLEPFDPTTLDFSLVAKARAVLRDDPTQECSIEIDRRSGRLEPLVRYDCGGTVSYTDPRGLDITDQVE